MKWTMSLAAALLLAGTASAEPPRGPPTAAQMEQMEKDMRTARTVELANALDLDAQGALKLESQLADFDQRRRPVMQQLFQLHQELEQIARGETKGDAGKVDQLVRQTADLEGQLRQLDLDQYTSLTQGLSAQQKARAAKTLLHGFGPPHHGMGHGPQGFGPPPGAAEGK